MFSPRQRPLLLVAERLFSLRLSINTPVVATDELPAGPARAAIAIHSEAGRTHFTVAVRSLRQGVSVLYELEGEDVTQPDGLTLALDASLSFGESMGFLFDDDMIVDRDPATLRRAMAQLREIVSAPGLEMGEEAVSEGQAAGDDGEILLEEAVEQASIEAPPAAAVTASEPRPAARPGAAPGRASPEAPLPAAAPMLTKFRAGPKRAAPSRKAAAAHATTAGGAMLGRVQPIRLRAPGAAPTVPPLLRLLAAF